MTGLDRASFLLLAVAVLILAAGFLSHVIGHPA